MSNSIFRVVGSGTTFLSINDIYVQANTNDGGQVEIVLPNSQLIFNDTNNSNTAYNFLGVRLIDFSNNASVNNIVVYGFQNELINNQQTITLNTNGSGGIFTLIGIGQWSFEKNTPSGGGTVESVTGLNTDNTDPTNPIINISVDGTTITGDGTPANPLVSSSLSTFTNPSPTPTTIGGISCGSTFTDKTMQEMWDLLLYPYQSPAFTLFQLQGISTLVEVGFVINTSQTFQWSTSNAGNVSPNTIQISGYSLVTLSGLPNDSSEAVNFVIPVTRNATDGAGTRAWSIQGTNTNSVVFSRGFSVRWDYRMYAGTNLSTSLTEAQIEALSNFNSLKNGFIGVYNLGLGGYKYFCWADEYGSPNTFKDTSSNLLVPMNTTYPFTQNGYSYDKVSVTNSQGATTMYRVYRTLNIIGAEINIAIT
jgi:hypothetical protein